MYGVVVDTVFNLCGVFLQMLPMCDGNVNLLFYCQKYFHLVVVKPSEGCF